MKECECDWQASRGMSDQSIDRETKKPKGEMRTRCRIGEEILYHLQSPILITGRQPRRDGDSLAIRVARPKPAAKIGAGAG